MPSRVLAWITDFGTSDHYVGTMKGVALSITPDLTLVDITHDVAPQDVLGGALELLAAHRFFPSGTIFVAVVDPGVGSSRKAIAAATGGFTFVGPDNGLLAPVLESLGSPTIVELSEPRFALPAVSRTFEGRDRFAPAAAWLARGTPLADLGRPLTALTPLLIPAPQASPTQLCGEVLRVDRFGNAVTNISRRALTSWSGGAPVCVDVGAFTGVGLVETYADVQPGAVCALLSSSDHLELAVARGDAAAALGLSRGSPVTVRRATAGLQPA
ncbi:MAG: SAM-dependent chlorinase/fluorinase [Vicinamibacterales bacterium]